MSTFVREYLGGAADHDVRQKRYAEFHCDACGANEDVDITGRRQTFRFNAPRRCPKCKSFGKDDRVNAIRKEIEMLTKNKSNIDVTIQKLTQQLSELTSEETSEETSEGNSKTK